MKALLTIVAAIIILVLSIGIITIVGVAAEYFSREVKPRNKDGNRK